MIEPRFGVTLRALLGLGGAILIGIAAAQLLKREPPPLPETIPPPDPNAPAYPVDLPAPPEKVAVTALSDPDLAARGITRVKLGEVDFPSGAIIAADPMVQPERLPFARKVMPGRYEITLYKAMERNALMVLRFAPGMPVLAARAAPRPGRAQAQERRDLRLARDPMRRVAPGSTGDRATARQGVAAVRDTMARDGGPAPPFRHEYLRGWCDRADAFLGA